MKDTLRVLLWIMMACFWSCSSEDEDISKPESNKIEISDSPPVVEQKSSTSTLTFTTNVAWTASVSSSTSWLKVSPTSGVAGKHTLTLITEENDTYDERNATVTIQAGYLSRNVTVTQKQKDALIVTSNKVEIGCVGGEFTIEAKANVSLTYEIEESAKEWISAGESRALTTNTLKFNAKTNEKDEARRGNIVLKGGDGLTETVTVYQEGEKPALVITSNDVIVGSEGETIKIELKSNVDYTMVLPDVDWISQAESRAISAYTHYLNIAPNESYDQRSAMVYVQNETEGLKDSISITQLQLGAIIVAKNEYEVAPEGGQLEFKVSSSVDFEVSTSVDWIKQNTGSRGLVEKTLSFTIEENEAKESRSGEIIITYGELKQTIKINQQGAPDYEAIERAALIEFYQATGGDNWRRNDNWCSDKPLDEWYGVKTNNVGRVVSIKLYRNQLTGSIPESIGNLSKLKVLYLYDDSQLSGEIPESICNLTKLTELIIEGQFTGEIPELIGNLTELERLYICKISGKFPESICKLSKLTELTLYGQFTGEIPESICNLSKLTELHLSGELTGNIPESIGNLSKLESLRLLENQLSGNIPESIGNLSKLEELRLEENQLSGNIPESIGNLSELTYLNLEDNQLSGSIPESIGNLSKLEELRLGYNKLSGNIPESIGNLSELTWLDFTSNKLSGNIPESIGNLTKLTYLDFEWNQLSGNIPESLGNLSNLTYLYFKHNQLSGTIPNFSKVTYLTLGANLFSGNLPEWIMEMEKWPVQWQWIVYQEGEGFSKEGLVIPAPKFSLSTIDGGTLDDGVYSQNEYTILYHYYNDCVYANSFTPKLVKIYEKFRNKGVEVIAFSNYASTASYHRDYAQKFNTQWPYILMNSIDNDNFIPYFGVSPNVDVVDKNGYVVFNHCQDDYADLEAFLVENLGEPDEVEGYYTSTDYSRDGEVVTLQTATQGQGINLTFMGEAFVDKDMETGGLYEQKMKEGMEKFFSIEPYKSLRNRFNVYAVKVVSPNAEWAEDAERRINLSNEVCFEYAQKIPNADKQRPMVSVIYNTEYTIDRSYTTMYGDGAFVGYMMDGVSEVLIHESGGHGFAKLLDEYVESELEYSTLPQDKVTYLDKMWSGYSWGANVDWRSDATTVKWAHFLNDSRYANEGLGLYEGAYFYGYGAYRPTENSMMRFGDGPFNAPSREQIYKRVMQLSEGENWKYDYEEFVKFDAKNRNAASRSAIQPLTEAERREYIKNHRPPTIIKGTWRDAMKKGKKDIVVPLR